MKTNTKPPRQEPIYTAQGAQAVRVNAELQLRRSVLSCMLWEDEFYEDGESIGNRIRNLVGSVAPEKVAALAVECREQSKLRHVPLLLVSEMARLKTHRAAVSSTLERIIQRPDELTEFCAIWQKNQPATKQGKIKLTAQIKKGLAAAFSKFDEYQFSKYDRDDKIRLRDVLFLSHAKPVGAMQAALFKNMFLGSCGQTKLPGKTVIIVDVSGSMNSGMVSKKSDMSRLDAAGALAAICRESCEYSQVYATAGNDMTRKHATMLVPAHNRGFALIEMFKRHEFQRRIGGGGIFLKQVMDYTFLLEKEADRVIVLTDEVDCDTKCKPADANAFGKRNYLINVSSAKNGIGYGKWTHIDGWSENVLNYINACEQFQG